MKKVGPLHAAQFSLDAQLLAARKGEAVGCLGFPPTVCNILNILNNSNKRDISDVLDVKDLSDLDRVPSLWCA